MLLLDMSVKKERTMDKQLLDAMVERCINKDFPLFFDRVRKDVLLEIAELEQMNKNQVNFGVVTIKIDSESKLTIIRGGLTR